MVLRNLALVGSGPWGQVYLKTLSEMGVNVTIGGRQNWTQVIDHQPDGVIVCTPPETHVQIASYALSRGIPTMIEKPLSLSMENSIKLKQFDAPILVNHTAIFTDAFERIRKFTEDNPISGINVSLYNYGPFRIYSSLWDYGPHALAIVLELIHEMPKQVKVNAILAHEEKKAILYDVKLEFSSNAAYCLVGNGGGGKRRTYSVKTDGITLMYDDMRRPESHTQPLNNAIKIFLNAMDGKDDWRLGLGLSLKVIKVLEMCQNQIDGNIPASQ